MPITSLCIFLGIAACGLLPCLICQSIPRPLANIIRTSGRCCSKTDFQRCSSRCTFGIAPAKKTPTCILPAWNGLCRPTARCVCWRLPTSSLRGCGFFGAADASRRSRHPRNWSFFSRIGEGRCKKKLFACVQIHWHRGLFFLGFPSASRLATGACRWKSVINPSLRAIRNLWAVIKNPP